MMRRGGDIFSMYLPLVHAWMLERSVDACASGVVVVYLLIAATVARDTVDRTLHCNGCVDVVFPLTWVIWISLPIQQCAFYAGESLGARHAR